MNSRKKRKTNSQW